MKSPPARSIPHVDTRAVRALAGYAGLPLAPGREQAVAAVLGAWLSECDALNRKMSAPEHQDLAPATALHPSAAEDGEH